MSRITWHEPGERFYHAGVDRGVVYFQDDPGIPWNGLTSLKETVDSGEITVDYQDGRPYRSRQKIGDYAATVEAFTFPEEVLDQEFGFTYRTMIGNDTGEVNYLIHIVYNAMAKIPDAEYQALDDSPDPLDFSIDISSIPIPYPYFRAISHVIIDTRVADPRSVADLETFLYGDDGVFPHLPDFDTVVSIFEQYALLIITDNGDGTWTATGPDDAIVMLSPTEFQITWPSAMFLNEESYKISTF